MRHIHPADQRKVRPARRPAHALFHVQRRPAHQPRQPLSLRVGHHKQQIPAPLHVFPQPGNVIRRHPHPPTATQPSPSASAPPAHTLSPPPSPRSAPSHSPTPP